MQELRLKIRGLYTHPDDLAAVPDGALSVADDIVIDKEELAEPRRGFDRLDYGYSTSSYRANKLFFFQDQLLSHYSTNLLGYYDSSSGWTAYSGTYAEPSSSAKVRSASASQNFYFTTGAGVYKLDSYDGTPVLAGAYKGLDVQASTSASSDTWLATGDQVAYRVVWGYRDANSNLLLGAPSQREIYENSSGATKAVDLDITIPDGVTTSWFYQIYRSSATTGTEPNDELGLVWEANPADAEITAGTINVTDITPDALRGAIIYTAATQEGLANGNEQPPMAQDVAVYKNTMFYANVTGKHRKYVTLLGADGTNGLAVDETIEIDGITYTAKAAESIANAQFLMYDATTYSGLSASQRITNTALSLVRVINQHANSTVYAYYLSGEDDLPGKILLEERGLGGGAFAVVTDNATAWSPDLTGNFTFVDADVSTANDTITEAAHGLSNGDPVTLSNSGGALPTGLSAATTYYVVEAATNTFKLSATEGGSAIDITAASGGGTHTLSYGESSSNDRYKNGIFFSKPSEPEAVPLGNFFFVGSADGEILRILPLRDSLFILKEDGIYRLSGEDSTSFRVDLFDSTTKLLAPDTAAVLNNQIYCLTDQGVVALTEAGVQVRSRPIEKSLVELQGINKSVLVSESFGVSYESERKYVLFVPTLSSDTEPTQAYVYNTFTNTWTRWVLNKTCGGVNPADDKLYLGDADSAYVNIERKSLDFTDYVDFAAAATVSAVDSTTLTMTNTDSVSAGDVIYQSSSVYSTVASVDTSAGTVTLDYDAGFSTGAVEILSSIASKIAWAPITFGNPAALKQYQELILLFREDFVGTGTVVFTTDASPSEESETFSGNDLGAWGFFDWGETPWGGDNVRRPFRMWVPRNKQRASQLIIKFQHSTGYTTYQLSGASLTGRKVSGRVAY